MRRSTMLCALALAGASQAGCSGGDRGVSARGTLDPQTGVSASPRVMAYGQPVPKGGGVYKVGSPYAVAGRWYVPREQPGYDATGIASWYGADFHGRRTANGEIFDMDALTAAHPTLPLPSYAYVTNEENGRTILVRINDRGPYAHDRVIDLSRRSAQVLGVEAQGLVRVRVRFAGPAPLDGDDGRERWHLAELARGRWPEPPRERAPARLAAEEAASWSPFDYRASVR